VNNGNGGKMVLIFLILFIIPAHIHPENDEIEKNSLNRAEHFCRRSIEEYSRNHFALSNHFLKLCEYSNIGYLESSPDALKLKALLLLQKNDMTNFIKFGKKSTDLRKDPLLSYSMAGIAIKTRRSDDAYVLLKDAINSSATISSKNKNESSTDEFFYCSIPDARGNKFPLQTSELSRENLSLAIVQLLALAKTSNKDKSFIRELENDLKKTAMAEDRVLSDLLTNPEIDINHQRCIENLKKEISSRKNTISEYRLKEAQGVILLLHKNRIAFNPVPETFFSYGSALQEAGNYRESLYAFRFALEKSGWTVSQDIFPNQKSSEVLYKIKVSYNRLEMKRDARTVERLADAIVWGAEKNVSDSAYRREVMNIAGENLTNREALLLLAADARWRNNGKFDDYMNRITERDKKMDGVELHSLFGAYYPY